MPALGAVLAYVFGIIGSLVTWLATAFVGAVVAAQVAEAVMRVVRIVAVFALFVAAVNLAIPDGVPISTVALWHEYVTGTSSWIGAAGWLIPFPLLFSLLDLYIAGASVVFCVWVVRRVVEASQ